MAIKDKANIIAKKATAKVAALAVSNKKIRKVVIKKFDDRMYNYLINKNPDNRPMQVQYDKLHAERALLHGVDLGIERKVISRKAGEKIFEVFLPDVFSGGSQELSEYYKKSGVMPPKFVAISPEGKCNLRCIGCYAASERNLAHIPYEVVSAFVGHMKNKWNAKFVVVPGGESFKWKSQGKILVDLAKEHNDCYFMPYTNGTLIDKEMAQAMAEAGNISPSISVEGFKEETDARRGKGVYDKILIAMENLRDEGVPFGISITVTKDNAHILLDDNKFYDFWFNEQMASYGWNFQYMPIGRGYTLEMLPTDEQVVKLIIKNRSVMKDDMIFFPDFWNSAVLSDGCIASRKKGYLYVEWNGKVTPCVFIPYSIDNIIDIYNSGGDFDRILTSEFFQKIRSWQNNYGYEQPAEKTGNWFTPCPMRHHYGTLYDIIMNTPGITPINKDAERALKDEEFRKGFIEYGEKIAKATCQMWQEEYIKPSQQLF